jgi:hypothetical protein
MMHCIVFSYSLIFFAFIPFYSFVGGNKGDIDEMYNLALTLYEKHNGSIFYIPKTIQLIRIPKASSTSLSVVARRLVGCTPPGPCCRFPGDPPGSCPSRLLYNCQAQFRVIGCTGHNVDYHSLLSKSVKTISIIREPKSRSLSAYFYPGHHHNSECVSGLVECFPVYLTDLRFRNIAVKMFTGEYAYAPIRTCRLASDCKHSLETAVVNLQYFEFIGIAELWELSLVVLHRKFPHLIPEITEFQLSEGTSDSEKLNSTLDVQKLNNDPSQLQLPGTTVSTPTPSSYNVRINANSTYLDFKNMALQKYTKELQQQNQYDLELYQVILQNFCNDLNTLGLWRIKKIQRYWRGRVNVNVEGCK